MRQFKPIVLLILGLHVPLDSTSAALQNTPPNIVFIMVDDMGYGDLPAYGATDVRTPNLDRFASQAVRLTNYYAAGAADQLLRRGS